jgi:putative methyltransferase (TIGR04325 family)
LQVCSGAAAFERDGVAFPTPEHRWPLLASLLHVAVGCKGRLRVMDFGGALGGLYFQCRPFLAGVEALSWHVVEQAHFVDVGRREFETVELTFDKSLPECRARIAWDVTVLSAVLPYMEDPYSLLEENLAYRPRFLLIDRTGFTREDRDRLTVQRVPRSICESSYPCWFLSLRRFREHVSERYEIVGEWTALDTSNLPCDFRGYLMQRKEEQDVMA